MKLPSLAVILVANFVWRAECNCNRVFQSNDESQVGSFEAPTRNYAKPFRVFRNERGNLTVSTNSSSPVPRKSIHCVYKFIAGPNERVALNFSSFQLRGDEPECNREYVDIFLSLASDENMDSTLRFRPPSGRFCTTVTPRRLISLHNMLLLVFHSDLEPPADRKPLFAGSFEFTKSKSHDQIGPPKADTLCSHVIESSSKREGEFQSVTYPGVYVKGLKCAYKFVGEPEQRIRLEFLDLDVYSGGSHCPLDSVKIFDGLEESDPLINTICGSHRSLIVYSTGANLLVTFSTFQREAEVQNRGFSAYFEFSDKFFDTNFIRGQNARHIRGSQCDQRIISHKGTSGLIVSPESKSHPNAICRYVFEGLQTSLEYERVLLKFTEFDLKGTRTITTNATQTSQTTTTTTAQPLAVGNLLSVSPILALDPSSSNATNSSAEQCTDNYVRIYTGEQKPDQRQDPNDYDYVFCSNELPPSIESDAASLLMEYNSGSIGGSFKAEYAFIVDFRIPGLQAPSGCNYIYRSDYMKFGTFNSPRHPSWYINDMLCSFTFLTKNDEALLLQFGTFKMANSFNEKVLGYNEACKGEDSVEIFELTLDSSEQRVVEQSEIGTYCGTTTPGPILSFRPVRVNFRANKEQVHYGFSALYGFHQIDALRSNEFVTNCGAQIHCNQKVKSGSFSSPETYRSETYEKRNHICSWNITARANHRIALNFTRFELEGSPLVRGCITASVRLIIGRSKIPTELCGSLSASNKSGHQFVSENEWLSVTFISTKQASGSNGFVATWTEIKRPA